MTTRSSRQQPLPGRLSTVTPEAFEEWVGELFTSLGYAVVRTPLQGDHGIDLNVERQGERAIVQCKHWPSRAVGEPVLRDLYGTLHHVKAEIAYLVTSGNATPAARQWANDKPIEIWDWQHLVNSWPSQIAELAARTTAGATTAEAVRPGWYVYVDDLGSPWAIKLPKSIGEHPFLGFQPLTDPNLEVVPKLVKLRHINLSLVDPPVRGGVRSRSVPVGTEQQRLALMRQRGEVTIDLPTADGGIASWSLGTSVGESGAYNPRVRKRATPTTLGNS